MSISLERASECIGRSAYNVDRPSVAGRVVKVDEHDVHLQLSDGEVIICIPDNLSWVSTLSTDIRDAIRGEYDEHDDAQVRYSQDISHDDDDDGAFESLHVVYSPADANDDDYNHPLYIIADDIRRVYLARINANPDGAREIEELLGWAHP